MLFLNPIVPKAEPSPSAKQDGLDADMEASMRFLGVHLIHLGARFLKLSPSATTTATILFHQYYCCHSLLGEICLLEIGMAAVLLASKVEECGRRVRDVVNVFHYLYTHHIRRYKYRPFGYVEEEYYEWRDRVTAAEMAILRTRAFHVTPSHPAPLMINYMNVLKLLKRKEICQRALNYLFDAQRGAIFTRLHPNVIACCAIHLACKHFNHRLPDNPHWFYVFDVTEEELAYGAQLIEQVYSIQVDSSFPIHWREHQFFIETFKRLRAEKSMSERRGRSVERGRRRSRSPSYSRSPVRDCSSSSFSSNHSPSRSPTRK